MKTGLLIVAVVLAGCAGSSRTQDRVPLTRAELLVEANAVDSVLTQLHDAASKADFDRYFDLYADDAIFLGTDATERWTKDQFIAYAKPHFDRGRGWTYTEKSRHVFVDRDGRTAWFDETLDNAGLGDTRGSGALVKRDGSWKIVQYNLTIPVPNDLASEVVRMIRAMDNQ
ncbi:MAG: nuclear transport factor 2 family protein [Bacteroidetes bacterium]|nr:nuclear transport factor 2 family protein [Bacteroidota bacterium]